MRNEEVRFKIELDQQRNIEKIFWEATEAEALGLQEGKAVSISIWDAEKKDAPRIDLWTKDMDVMEMKQFQLYNLGGIADTIRRATGDEEMAADIEALCQKLVERLSKEWRGEQP